MKSKLLLIIIVTISFKLFSQTPADSLVGIYVGEQWYADPAGSPWVITPDTIYVYFIDSTICKAQWWSSSGSSSLNFTYCTDYFSCYNPNPQSPYQKFYSKDSIRTIINSMPQPYPHLPVAYRHYGKRIPGSNGLVGIHESTPDVQFTIFPNPFSEEVTIETGNSQVLEIIVYSITGKQVYQHTGEIPAKINLSFLENGLYVVEIKTDKGIEFNKLTKIK